jgi:hypothetical protein
VALILGAGTSRDDGQQPELLAHDDPVYGQDIAEVVFQR